MADWVTISSFATAGGTLVLAVVTFASVRSANRTARVAEQSLLTTMRPLLVASLADDPAHKVLWNDRHSVRVPGGGAVAEETGDVIYLAMNLRNVGSGLALLHGWFPRAGLAFSDIPHAEVSEFRRLTVDLYIPSGGTGYWEGAIRQSDDHVRNDLRACITDREPFTVELLYGDQEGGQRRVSRFTVLPHSEDGWYCQSGRHWNVDSPDPR